MLALLLFASAPLNAAPTATAEGSGDRSDRDAARRAIPWRQLTPASRKAIETIVTRPTLYRQLPSRVIDCDGDLFAYLTDHPELVVDCWNVMGVSRLQLRPSGPGRYRVADSAGAVGDVRVLYRHGGGDQPLTMVLLADGAYQTPPMPKPIRGSSVLLLRATTVNESNGRSYVTTRLDSFIRFDGKTTALVARTLQPLIVRTADHNFVETMRFVSLFSRTAETNPAGMQRLAGNLRQVDDRTRQEFSVLCHQTAERYATRRRERVALATPAALR